MKVGFKKMLSKHGQPQHIFSAKRLLIAGLVSIFAWLFFSPSLQVQANSLTTQQYYQPGEGPSILSIQAGFNGTYRLGNWIPIQVKVNNNGSAFDGTISVSLSTSSIGSRSSSASTSVYQTAISLPAISQKQITFYVPIEDAANGQGTPNRLTIHLQNSNNRKLPTNLFPLPMFNQMSYT